MRHLYGVAHYALTGISAVLLLATALDLAMVALIVLAAVVVVGFCGCALLGTVYLLASAAMGVDWLLEKLEVARAT